MCRGFESLSRYNGQPERAGAPWGKQMSSVAAHTFRSRFREHRIRRRLLGERSKILVAVSGGVDSIVLLDLLAGERDHLALTLAVAHFNHQLRGAESDDDETFVKERSRAYGLECYVERADTAEVARLSKQGVQETARTLRYDFFAKLLLSSGFDRVATAHNADDNAETVLLNLFRGAGVQGLAGIPVFRSDRNIIRPLLFAERKDIKAYAQDVSLPFREDSSNDTDHYTRNFIRHRVIPLVQEQINPTIVQTLNRSSEVFRELEAYLSYNARHHLDLIATRRTADDLHLAIPGLRGVPVLLRQHIVMLAAERFTGRRPDFDQTARVLDLMEGMTGTWVPLSQDHVVFRDRDALVFRKAEPLSEFRIVVQQNHAYDLGNFHFSSELLPGVPDRTQGPPAEFVDADKLKAGDLILRTWSEGDAFMPLGMRTMKKVSDFFVDAKVPVYEKRRFPILETADGAIVWVCGQRIDDRFKVTKDTRRVLKLEFHRSQDRPDGAATSGQR
jgi:tRNA(Ile)-lysidine synthase